MMTTVQYWPGRGSPILLGMIGPEPLPGGCSVTDNTISFIFLLNFMILAEFHCITQDSSSNYIYNIMKRWSLI